MTVRLFASALMGAALTGILPRAEAAPPALPPLAHAELEKGAHAALSTHGIVAELDVRHTTRCTVPIVWTDADSSPTSPCSMAFLTLRTPGNTQAHASSFPLTPYGTEDDGMAQLRMSFRQLDASSPFPQVMVSAYTGGAHCCSLTSIFDLRSNGHWQHLELGGMDGDGEPQVVDLVRNGQQEILTSDQSFLYAFASHAGSEAPVVISRYHDGVLENVTRDPVYRDYLAKDLADRRRNWTRSGRLEPNGFLAYEVATMANLGKFSEGWRDMLAHAQSTKESGFGLSLCDLKPAAEKQNGHGCSIKEKELLPFPEALSAFLVQSGYITPEQAASVRKPQDPSTASQAQALPPTVPDTGNPTSSSSALARPPETDTASSPSVRSTKSSELLPVLAGLGLAFYFLPMLIAYRRDTVDQRKIAIITVLLGWTIIGWIAALVMALTQRSRKV
ncbi:superinfection immunity protein [Gluconobacter albidus]|uniref:superinfection immunity protein n=1 Tax=Gluconobacter albidus TaxID=318683 RepID=UPI0030AFDE99